MMLLLFIIQYRALIKLTLVFTEASHLHTDFGIIYFVFVFL